MKFEHDGCDEWPFDQEPSVAAITTRQVLELHLPVLVVSHYSNDHSWAFVCGTTDDYREDGRVVCMADILKSDPSLCHIADLPPGWSAERNDRDSEWRRYPDAAA